MASRSSRKGSTVNFVGRDDEKREIIGFAHAILDDPVNQQTSVITLIGDSGIGKSALGLSAMSEVKLLCLKRKKILVSLRSTSTEDQQRIPLW
jgi:predicted ATP-dependent serine protease